MAELAKQFVCVRIQSMNCVNINQFQFEYDLTWMAFFQNADGRTYTRYGGREDHDAESHLSKNSLLGVMRQVLELHRDKQVQPVSRYEPVGETVRIPEDIPPMTRMLARRKEASCIHCHDVKNATLRHASDLGKLRKEMVYTYPSPSNVGLRLDANAQNVVRSVADNSSAARAGVQSGDVILSADGQRVLTFADLTRVLELTPDDAELPIQLRRGDQVIETTLRLEKGWRKNTDVSWRSSVEVVGPNGGFWGAKASPKQRRELGLDTKDLALRVTFIWGKWTREAGIKNGDIVVTIDGKQNDMNVRQIHAHLQLNRDWGDTVPVVVRRGDKRLELTMQLPSGPSDP